MVYIHFLSCVRRGLINETSKYRAIRAFRADTRTLDGSSFLSTNECYYCISIFSTNQAFELYTRLVFLWPIRVTQKVGKNERAQAFKSNKRSILLRARRKLEGLSPLKFSSAQLTATEANWALGACAEATVQIWQIIFSYIRYAIYHTMMIGENEFRFGLY